MVSGDGLTTLVRTSVGAGGRVPCAHYEGGRADAGDPAAWERDRPPVLSPGTVKATAPTRPLLLVGLPRSGTTWTMQVLESAPGFHPILEPDNEGASAPAIWGKHRAGRFPALHPGDDDERYRRLWGWILQGAPRNARQRLAAHLLLPVQRPGRTRFLQGHPPLLMRAAGTAARRPSLRPAPAPAAGRLLVKTVHAPLSIEWLAATFDVDVLVVLRHPGNVLASWLSLDLNEQYVRLEQRPEVRRGWTDRWGVGPPESDPLAKMVWEIGLLTAALEESALRHPAWVVRTHEQLCREPGAEFKQLLGELRMDWSEAVEDYLRMSDAPGSGFATKRVAAELPDAWKSKLTTAQVATMRRVLEPFPLVTWTAEDYRTTG